MAFDTASLLDVNHLATFLVAPSLPLLEPTWQIVLRISDAIARHRKEISISWKI